VFGPELVRVVCRRSARLAEPGCLNSFPEPRVCFFGFADKVDGAFGQKMIAQMTASMTTNDTTIITDDDARTSTQDTFESLCVQRPQGLPPLYRRHHRRFHPRRHVRVHRMLRYSQEVRA
jgi:hypothetical protein